MASQGHVLAKRWIAELEAESDFVDFWRPRAIGRPTNLIERSLKP
jgi:hypothetical protein